MDHKIEGVIKLYKALTGRNIIPKDTDPTRTYQYRYAANFIKKMENVSWETIRKIVYYAIEYAKENDKKSVYTRGLWILTKSNIIDIAYKKAKEEDDRKNIDLNKVRKSCDFAKKHDFNFAKSEDGGFPNLVIWYERGNISLTYLAMSESCKNAMRKLDKMDKSVLPSQEEIIKRRVKCMIDHEYCTKIKEILGNDYIKITNGENRNASKRMEKQNKQTIS